LTRSGRDQLKKRLADLKLETGFVYLYVIRFTLEEMPERLAQLETSQGHSLRLQWASAQGRHREDILPSSTS